MASTTVAPVESYTSDSIVPTPDNYAQFGVKTHVAVNLVDSNLWLVDNSRLAAQITDTANTVPLLDWTVKSQTTVPLENITAVDQPVNLATNGQSDLSQYTVPDAPLDGMLQLSAVSGQTRLGGSLGGSGGGSSSGSTSGGSSSLISTTSFQSESGSGAISSFSGLTSLFKTSSTALTSGTPADGSGTSTGTSTSTPTSTLTSTSTGTPELPATSAFTDQTVPNFPPNISSNPPVPVPFDFSASLGLTVLIAIWGSKRMARFWCSHLRFKHWG
jgi:hypothetical protein